ncbi:extracellular solute-binding protein [Nonomuraea roseola]|uniref:Extracellular solute-binding protein n=1 Tax=Nonomuraea roseola TaxID=46179 RepID=A0ABV5Q871_9ACTN
MRRHVVAAAAASLLLAGCGGAPDTQQPAGSQQPAAKEKVTLEWWHILTSDPGKGIYAKWAKDFEAAHPNVTVKITVLENESFKSKMATQTASGKAPSIFTTWGGGVLQQQAEAGLVKDLTADAAPILPTFSTAAMAAYQIDGKAYAIPTDIGMVGFWYNKKLFAKAGVSEPPATWSAYLDAVKKLKAAGVTPIALAGKEKWPGHYYWAYLAMRVAGLDALKQAAETKDFTGPDFVAAGTHLKALADLHPFQTGFQNASYSTPSGQAATVSNGKAAMELMGQWAPDVQKSSGKGLGEDLGFFPFPAVEGGKGAITDAFGGGQGFAVGADAPAEAVEFLQFISDPARHREAITNAFALPVIKGTEDAVTNPALKLVVENLTGASGFQLYLDQAYPPAVGQEVNDSVAQLIVGGKTPEEVVRSITETAKSE